MNDKKMKNNQLQPGTSRRDPFYSWLGYLSQPVIYLLWFIVSSIEGMRCMGSGCVGKVNNPFWVITMVYAIPAIFLLSFIIYISLFVYAKKSKNINLLSYAKGGLWSYLIFTVPVDLFLISEIIRTTPPH